MEIGDNAIGDDCPVAPPYRTTIQSRVLHRACQKLGGVMALASHLRVPPAALYRWLDGEEEPPTPVFLKAVDLVMPTWGPEDDALARELSARRPSPK
ncbi:MAG TPA: hypothetical protein VD965_13225 [Burkholderiales bacterium]|nr:hypothetical protein [Burkholderiales bacterium]